MKRLTGGRRLSPLTRLRLWRLAAALAVVGAVAWLFVVNPTGGGWAPQCPFRLVTGLSCPGCGFQRAMHAALHGRWAEAAGYNLFLTLALPYLALVFTAEYLMRGQRRDRFLRVIAGPPALAVYVALFIAWGIVRNVLGI